MELSNSGKVLIIDDKYEEALPLIRILGRKNIPYLYYEGKSENLPAEQIKGIRFIFLDIQLVSTHDNKTMASSISVVIQKILSPDNGPFTILFWTKHNEVCKFVIDNLKKINFFPIGFLNLEKSDYKFFDEKSNEEFDYDKLLQKLKDELQKIKAFQIYVDWENMLNNAGIKYISDFSKLFSFDEKWSDNTNFLFYKLYKSVVEKNEAPDDKKINIAFLLLNMSFSDYLQNETNVYNNDEFKLTGSKINIDISAKINSILHLSFDIENIKESGLCYICENNDLKEFFFDLLEKIIDIKDKDSMIFCRIFITPNCDIAQKKFKYHRTVSGVIIDEDKSKFKGKFSNDFYNVGPIYFQDKVKYLIINFQTISSGSVRPENIDDSEKLFKLKTSILNDIQSKASNHVNRLGTIMLKK